MSYQVDDRFRVLIPDTTDPDRRYHGEVGRIAEILHDDLGGVTGDPRDNLLYRVAFEDAALGRMSFRHHDLERVDRPFSFAPAGAPRRMFGQPTTRIGPVPGDRPVDLPLTGRVIKYN